MEHVGNAHQRSQVRVILRVMIRISGVVPLRHLRHVPSQSQLRLWLIRYVREKRAQFSLHNFSKCRHNFLIFGMNHPEDSFYQKIENLFLILCDDVNVTSSKATLSVPPPRKRYNNILYSNFRKLKRIVIFAKRHERSKEKLSVQRKSTSTN